MLSVGKYTSPMDPMGLKLLVLNFLIIYKVLYIPGGDHRISSIKSSRQIPWKMQKILSLLRQKNYTPAI